MTSRMRRGYAPAIGKTRGRFRIVCRQVNHPATPGELADRAERGASDLVGGADAVYPAGEHQSLIVGRVTGQEIGHALILDNDRDVIRRVTRRRHGDDITGAVRRLLAEKGPYASGARSSGIGSN